MNHKGELCKHSLKVYLKSPVPIILYLNYFLFRKQTYANTNTATVDKITTYTVLPVLGNLLGSLLFGIAFCSLLIVSSLFSGFSSGFTYSSFSGSVGAVIFSITAIVNVLLAITASESSLFIKLNVIE